MEMVHRLLEVWAACVYSNIVYLYWNSLVVLVVLAFTDYWPIIPLYIIWIIYDRETPFKGGRRSTIVRYIPYPKFLRDYFPARIHKTADIPADKNYIFGNHPHGALNTATFCNFMIAQSPAEDLFPGLKFFTAALDFNFIYPLLRDLALGWSIVSCSARSFRYLLNDSNKGNVINLPVGGAEEVKYTKPGDYNIILKKRKGFIKLGLTLGCGLVPIFHFGENDIFEVSPLPGPLGRFITYIFNKYFGAEFCMPTGRSGLLKFVPKRVPLNTVVGKPIDLPKISEPTQEQIDHYHSLYTEALVKLFEDNKHKYDLDPGRNLIIH